VAQIENGQVRLHRVTVARDLGSRVEICSRVKPGNQVILNPSVDLADGSKVKRRSKPVKVS
jgi:hypothetical protein